MKTPLVFMLVLMPCYLCRAQQHSRSNDNWVLDPKVEKENKAETPKTTTEPETEGGGEELQADIWAELRILRDMVVELKVELRHLTARVVAAESLTGTLQEENRAMEARMRGAESLAEELQMENDAQALELAITQQKISTLQQRLTVNELFVQELQKQQEGHEVAVQELQNANRVSKLAFSTSLLESGEGNTSSEDYVPLLFSNLITNIGNHYNQNTGHFTAPAKGVYYFTFTGFTAHTESSMRLRLVKNGNLIVFAGDCATSTDSEDNASNAAVLHLEVGDVVAVQRAGSVWDDQYHRTTFSGFLLFPL